MKKVISLLLVVILAFSMPVEILATNNVGEDVTEVVESVEAELVETEVPVEEAMKRELTSEQFTIDGVYYQVLADGTLNGRLMEYSGGNTYTLPATVNGYAVSEWSFFVNTTIEKLILSETVAEIDCTQLEGLKEIEAPSNNPHFKSLNGLLLNKTEDTLICCPVNYQAEVFVVPESVRVIEEQAILGCKNIVKIELPDELYSIRMYGIMDNPKLEEIHVEYADVEKYLGQQSENPEAYISNAAIAQNPLLKCVDIPGGIQYGMLDAYGSFCQECEFTVMPNYRANLEIIEFFVNATKVYGYTGSLTDRYCAGYDIPFESMKEINSLIFDYEGLGNNEIRITAARIYSATEYTIPETIDGKTVTEIGSRYNQAQVFPVPMAIIGSNAPSGACNLEKVVLPDTLKKIGQATFMNCTIPEIKIPDTITAIEDYAFMNSAITSIEIPEKVTSVGHNAFSMAYNLKEIVIPETVTEVLSFAFSDCASLTDVTILSKEKYYDSVFDGSAVENLVFPQGTMSIYTRSGMDHLKSLTLPETVADIVLYGEYPSLKEMNIPGEVFDIRGDFAQFASNGCVINGDTNSKAEEIARANGITFNAVGEIEKTNFTFVAAMEDGGSSGSYDEAAEDGSIFIMDYNGGATNELVIPNSYGSRKIVGIARNGSTMVSTEAIETVVIEDGVKYIEDFGILYQLPNCSKIYVPDSVTYIGKNALSDGSGNTIYVYGKTGSYVQNWVKEKNNNSDGPGKIYFVPTDKPEVTYHIEFDANGGYGYMYPITNCKNENSYTLTPNQFVNSGYVFKEWNTKADGSGKAYADKASVTNLTSTDGKTVTLYAQWEKEKYTITYELNGGKNHSSNPTSYNAETPTMTLKAPTKKGYTFKGWYWDKDYIIKATKIEKGSTGNITLYAKWSANKYSIAFNGNNATSGKMSTLKDKKYGSNVTLTKNAFKRTGYKFKGWNTKEDGKGTSYTDGAKVKNLTSSNGKTVTLYAQWEKAKYSITYKLDGGKNHSKNPATYTYTTSTIKLQKPTKTNYTFVGWYSDSKLTKKVTEIKKGSTGSKTLYAKWAKNKYDIKFDGNGATSGKMSTVKSVIFDKTVTLTKNTFSKTGYTFKGWNTKKDGKGTSYTNQQKVKGLTKSNNKTVTLYAQWSKNQYNIKFDKNGATSGSMSTIKNVSYDKTVSLTKNAYKRTGYTFIGWNTKKDGKGKSYSNGQKVSKLTATNGKTVTLYAQWKVNKYNITYNLNGGKNNSSNPKTYTVNNSVTLKNPTRTGYTFKGWYTDSKFTKKFEGITKGSTGNVKVYAKWKAKKSSVIAYDCYQIGSR